jgi:glycosyltransferase involved in cell wall biosynthesis
MKLMFVMSLPYEPATGGANKANRTICELLSRRGHNIQVLAPALGVPTRWTLHDLECDLRRRQARLEHLAGLIRFSIDEVHVHAIIDRRVFRAYLIQCIQAEQPDWVLVSSEELTQNLLAAALETAGRVGYLVHTPCFLPFGPHAFFPGTQRAELFRRIARIIAVSKFSADYIQRWAGLKASVCYLPVYGTGPFPQYGRFGDGYITMVNPCSYKGIKIFLDVARRFPELPFAAVPTWGTTSTDLDSLRSLNNVTILESSPDIDTILEHTRVLLVPSLWPENFGMIIVEAKLRGIPVIASEVGGTPEATLGSGLLVSVRPIQEMSEDLDENHLPKAVVPEQNIEPWISLLRRLVQDESFYRFQSEVGVERASRFVESLSIDHLEQLLTAEQR